MADNLRHKAETALSSGDFDAAREALIEAVRAEPGDTSLRSFLFQFSALSGEWARARKQLEVIRTLKPEATDFVEDYLIAIAAEGVREAVWSGRFTPSIFGEPRPWIAGLVQALKLDAAGKHDEADAVRRGALDAAPALVGSINGTSFRWIGDSDNRLGPVLEVVINGEYHWISLEEIAKLDCEPPKDLRDYVWTVGVMTLATGAVLPVIVPTRYPGAATAVDPQIRAGRMTSWRELSGGLEAGEGQRVLATDEGDHAMMELRELKLEHGSSAAIAALQDEEDGG